MNIEGAVRDRRMGVRVCARGRVVLHADRSGRGKILDVSSTGVRFRLAGALGGYLRDERVVLELRFDGAKGGWWRMSGRISRITAAGEIAIAFDDVPNDFEDWIQSELVASIESQRVTHVLVVDPVSLRRGDMATTLRANGHRVSEAATPLDAIAQLGESQHRPRFVAIADTVPACIANDLRAFVGVAHPDLMVVRMMKAAA